MCEASGKMQRSGQRRPRSVTLIRTVTLTWGLERQAEAQEAEREHLRRQVRDVRVCKPKPGADLQQEPGGGGGQAARGCSIVEGRKGLCYTGK